MPSFRETEYRQAAKAMTRVNSSGSKSNTHNRKETNINTMKSSNKKKRLNKM